MTDPLVALTPYGRNAGSSRVRVFTWLEHTGVPSQVHDFLGTADLSGRTLARHGWRAGAAQLQVSRLHRQAPSHLLIHRAASPLSAGGVEERLLRSAGASVYDFDDAIQWEPHTRMRRLIDPTSRVTRSLRAADRVIAGNAVLGDFASLVAREVVVIPSCVEPARYRRKTDYELADPPLLGWIGSRSTERFLVGIGEALREVHRRTGARLQVVGSPDGDLGPLEAMTDRIAWSERAAERLPATWDVGLMPLADRLYERGKCAYKLLQYGAAALPAVASPVGLNDVLVHHPGFVRATTHDEWVESVLGLLQASSSLREDLGTAARRFVVEQYSYDVWRDQWLAAVSVPSLPRGPQTRA